MYDIAWVTVCGRLDPSPPNKFDPSVKADSFENVKQHKNKIR